ncbi:GSU2203 family decaheme c-type cytochrome [Thermodesulfatator atlanticus]|uniref:GSU2203 family decaheme c-type cytochrome n=1 Tax=Thermodesulfatator atlanticus TaxID=501497 RepID=UPI001FE1E6CF|nr:GSU2203 family decaheme c-type cytochrome [Thermodesulfatator atlanticus]
MKPPEVAPGAEYVGSETCLECHEDRTLDAKHNVHMRLANYEAPGYQVGCEGCHGPGSVHVDAMGEDETEKGLAAIIRFGEEGFHGEEASAVCLTCHADGETMHFAGSAHAEHDVDCLACHKVHDNPRPLLLAQKEFDLCSKCHRDVQAKMFFISRHPVKEGHMTCGDCHNPHGTGNPIPGMLRTEERLNDLCLTCHTRYQGPFVFEHDPVIEDCTICHDPHGAVANNLLKQNEPFICLQCHEAHFHATRDNAQPGFVFPDDTVINDAAGTGTDPVLFKDPYTGETPQIVSSAHGWQKSFLTKCTQCHQQVHGSDLPSQSLPSRGMGLTR